MIDSLLVIGAILAGIVGSGALSGGRAVQSKGGLPFSWIIVIRSTIVGVLLAGVIMFFCCLVWVQYHRWAGTHSTLFVFEGLSSLAVGSVLGWIAAYALARHWHTPMLRSNRTHR